MIRELGLHTLSASRLGWPPDADLQPGLCQLTVARAPVDAPSEEEDDASVYRHLSAPAEDASFGGF
jgi:hypothetical protein